MSGRSTTVKIRENNADNEPGDLVATLTDPASLTADSLNTFTAPAGTTLAASKTYWLTVGEGISSNRAQVSPDAFGNDETGETGWSIGDGSLWRTDETDVDWSDLNLFPADDNQRHRRALRRHLVRHAHCPGPRKQCPRLREQFHRQRVHRPTSRRTISPTL